MTFTKEELEGVRKAARFDAEHVGAPGCIVRQRAAVILRLVDYYEAQAQRGEIRISGYLAPAEPKEPDYGGWGP